MTGGDTECGWWRGSLGSCVAYLYRPIGSYRTVGPRRRDYRIDYLAHTCCDAPPPARTRIAHAVGEHDAAVADHHAAEHHFRRAAVEVVARPIVGRGALFGGVRPGGKSAASAGGEKRPRALRPTCAIFSRRAGRRFSPPADAADLPPGLTPPEGVSAATYYRPGYNFDGCTPEVVLSRMMVRNGRSCSPTA